MEPKTLVTTAVVLHLMIGTSSAFGAQLDGNAAFGNRVCPAPQRHEDNAGVSPHRVMIERSGAYHSTLFMIEVRNVGDTPVDMCALTIVADVDGWSSDRYPTVARGACDLPPGQVALILTHPGIPVNDEARASYGFVFVALRADGELPIIPGGVRILDALDRVVASSGSDDPEPIGICCRPGIGEPCYELYGGPCDGSSPMCAAYVMRNYCCNDLNGCCFEESDAEYCQGRGCNGVSPDYSCP